MTTLYNTQKDGSVEFRSEQTGWVVNIPAYILDLWTPLLGSDAMGVYLAYLRLERDGVIKGMTFKKLAIKCRIGSDKLARINEWLVDCGFIRIEKPEGWQKLAHFTTKVIVLNAPTTVPAEAIEKYRPKDKDGNNTEWEYEPLSDWLFEDRTDAPKDLNGFSGVPNQVLDKDPNRDANIVFSSVLDSSISFDGAEKTPHPSRPQSKRRLPPSAVSSPSGESPEAKPSALETWVATTSKKKLTVPMRRDLDLPTYYWDKEANAQVASPSPNVLFDTNPAYRDWLIQKRLPQAVTYKSHPGPLAPSEIIKMLHQYEGFLKWCAETGKNPQPKIDPNETVSPGGMRMAPARPVKMKKEQKNDNTNP